MPPLSLLRIRPILRPMDPQQIYRHTQYGRMIWLVLMLALIVSVAAAVISGFPLLPIIAITAALILLSGWLFGSLTVAIEGGRLSWWFGPGFWTKRAEIAEVEGCEPVRNRWWWGFGIRYYGKGWLYNISGLDAVEIRLKSGRYFRIGTDEPDALAAAIRSVQNQRDL